MVDEALEDVDKVLVVGFFHFESSAEEDFTHFNVDAE